LRRTESRDVGLPQALDARLVIEALGR